MLLPSCSYLMKSLNSFNTVIFQYKCIENGIFSNICVPFPLPSSEHFQERSDGESNFFQVPQNTARGRDVLHRGLRSGPAFKSLTGLIVRAGGSGAAGIWVEQMCSPAWGEHF